MYSIMIINATTCTPSREMWVFPFRALVSLLERNFEWKLQRSIKNIRYEEPFSIESLKESTSKVWFEVYFEVSAKTSIKTRRDWENTLRKLLLTAFSLKLNGFETTHTYYLQNSKYSFHCCIASYEKRCMFREYLTSVNRHTHTHTRWLL